MTAKSKLVRTLLSKKPRPGAALASILSLGFLTLIFAVDQENAFGLSRYLTASSTQVFADHEYWRAFTAPLVHADLGHLGSNALFFGGLAFLLNGYFGGWVFPTLSFISGGLINFVVLPFYPAEAVIVGASGIVHFMAAFWLTLYFAIERRLSYPARLMNVIAFSAVLFIPEALQENVSYLSHAIGFGLGVISGALYFSFYGRSIQAHEVWEEEPLDCELDEDCAASAASKSA
jgi:rhomboid protease GluP